MIAEYYNSHDFLLLQSSPSSSTGREQRQCQFLFFTAVTNKQNILNMLTPSLPLLLLSLHSLTIITA